jgi:hypothetical protein
VHNTFEDHGVCNQVKASEPTRVLVTKGSDRVFPGWSCGGVVRLPLKLRLLMLNASGWGGGRGSIDQFSVLFMLPMCLTDKGEAFFESVPERHR